MIRISVNTRHAYKVYTEMITSGSSGIPVSFIFSSDWDGLTKIASFRGSGVGRDMVLDGDTAIVPYEVLTTAGGELMIGVYGTDGQDGAVIIPTIWADVGRIREGVHPCCETDPQPTASVIDQVLTAAMNAVEQADAAAKAQAEIAAGHAEDAANSASAAAGSATAAAESAASASASKTAAAGSASAAHADSAAAIAAKNAAETAQGVAEEARDTAVSAKNAAETAQRKAETAQGKAETAKTAAEAAAQSATGSASSASASATAAGSSATSAAGSASSAHTDAAAALEAKNTAVSAKDTAVASKIAAEAARGAAGNAATNASGSAIAAANSATAAANSATAAAASAETAAEVEARAEEVAESIPEDYSELSGDVADLKSAIYPNNLAASVTYTSDKAVLYNTGELKTSPISAASDYIDISGITKITYTRVITTSSSTNAGVAFYDSEKVYKEGIRAGRNASVARYDIDTVDVPEGVNYIRMTEVPSLGPAQLYDANDEESIKGQLDRNTKDIETLFADTLNIGTTVKAFHNLINYDYDTPYDLAPTSSPSSAGAIGIKRDKNVFTLNTVVAPAQNIRVKLCGEMMRTGSGNTAADWYGITLTSGHRYRIKAIPISGASTASEPNAIGMYRHGYHTSIGDAWYEGATYCREFTSDGEPLTMVWVVYSGATYTDYKCLVTLEDITSEADQDSTKVVDYNATISSSSQGENTGTRLKVVSYNVAAYNNDTSVYLPTEKEINFKKMLCEIKPDILAIQEDKLYIDGTGTRLALTSLYNPIFPYEYLETSGLNCTVRSRTPADTHDLVKYSNGRWIEYATYTINSKTLLFGSTHTVANYNGTGIDSEESIAARLIQYQEIVNWLNGTITLKKINGGASVYCPSYDWCVMCGDFNTITASDMASFKSIAETGGFKLANGDWLGWIETNYKFKNAPMCLDNVMVTPNVIFDSIISHSEMYRYLYSDHVPFEVTVTLQDV